MLCCAVLCCAGYLWAAAMWLRTVRAEPGLADDDGPFPVCGVDGTGRGELAQAAGLTELDAVRSTPRGDGGQGSKWQQVLPKL